MENLYAHYIFNPDNGKSEPTEISLTILGISVKNNQQTYYSWDLCKKTFLEGLEPPIS